MKATTASMSDCSTKNLLLYDLHKGRFKFMTGLEVVLQTIPKGFARIRAALDWVRV